MGDKSHPYKTKSGLTQYKASLAWLEEVMFDGNMGFCLACGEEAEGVERDARRYECEFCGQEKVYGAEEIALMGLVYGDDED